MIDPFECFCVSLVSGANDQEGQGDGLDWIWRQLVGHIESLGATPIPPANEAMSVNAGFWAVNGRIVAEFNKYRVTLSNLSVNISPFIDARAQRILFVCDLDSTLIQTETIDEMAKLASLEAYYKVHELTRASMEGNYDFCDTLKKRCAILKGLNAQVSFI